jgi:hypothetical protein
MGFGGYQAGRKVVGGIYWHIYDLLDCNFLEFLGESLAIAKALCIMDSI